MLKKLFIASVLGLSLTTYAQNKESSASTQNQDSTSINTSTAQVAPQASSPQWKMSTTASLTNLGGTQAAATYSFGDVSVYNQNLTAERTINASQKISVKAQFIRNDYVVNSGAISYREVSSGFGDTLMNLSTVLAKQDSFVTVLDTGVFLPTGTVNVNHEYAPNVRYKYFLQLGSGTVDPTISLTQAYNSAKFQTGAKLTTVQRYGHNENGYRFGDMYRADAWGFLPVGNGVTLEALGYFRKKTSIDGQDRTLSRAATEFYYHDQNDWAVYAAAKYSYNLQPNLAATAELGVPAAQGMSNIDNVVISTRYFANVSLSGTF